MKPFGLTCSLIAGALLLGTPVSSFAQERAYSPGTSGAKKAAKTTDKRAGARLKLEPLELSVDSDPHLRLSASLGDLSEVPPKQRAQAAALWQALNTTPEDVLRNAQRGQALAGDMEKLRDAVTRNTDQLTELRVQLAQAQASRTYWRYALMAVLAFSVLLVVLAWRRSAPRGPDSEWWNNSDGSVVPSSLNRSPREKSAR